MIQIGIDLSSARNRGFTPLARIQQTNPLIWLSGDTISGIADGAAIQTWVDQSAAPHSPTQANSTKRPIFRLTGGALSKPAGEFDGIDDFLQVSFTWNQPEHVFFVARCLTAPANGDTLFDGASGNAMRFLNNAGKWSLLVAGGGFLDSAQAVDTSWHLFECKFNGASSSIRVDDNPAVAGALGASGAGGLTLGLFGDGASAPTDLRIAELAGYSGIQSISSVAQIRATLQGKYGL